MDEGVHNRRIRKRIPVLKHRRLSLFAYYAPLGGGMGPEIRSLLKMLADISDSVIFIADKWISDEALEDVKPWLTGYDCGANSEGLWLTGVRMASEAGMLISADDLILVDNSAFLSSFAKNASSSLLRLLQSGTDFIRIIPVGGGYAGKWGPLNILHKNLLQRSILEAMLANAPDGDPAPPLESGGFTIASVPTPLLFQNPLTQLKNCFPEIEPNPTEEPKDICGLAITNFYSFLDQLPNHGVANRANYSLPSEKPGISVILPVVNRPDSALDVIESVMEQPYNNFELIVVDAGHEAGLRTDLDCRLSGYLESGKLRYLRSPQIRGSGVARGTGIREAKFDWILHLSCDYALAKNSLPRIALNLMQPDIEAVHFVGEQQRREKSSSAKQSIRRRIDGLAHRKHLAPDLSLNVYPWTAEHDFGMGLARKAAIWLDHSPFLLQVRREIPVASPVVSRKIHAIVKKDEPIVTTIITSRNHHLFIGQAIESALEQSGSFKHEIIVSDDASWDDTAQIVFKYEKKYPHLIRFLNNFKHVGQAVNIRQCIASARGDYICFLDGDDWWIDDKKINMQINFLKHNPDCSMVFSGICVMGEDMPVSPPGPQRELPQKFRMFDMVKYQNPLLALSSIMVYAPLMRSLPGWLDEYWLSEWGLCAHCGNYGMLGYLPKYQAVHAQRKTGLWHGQSSLDRNIANLKNLRLAFLGAHEKDQDILNRAIQAIESNLASMQEKDNMDQQLLTRKGSPHEIDDATFY